MTSPNSIENIVRVVCKRDDKILVCKSKEFGHYYLPGGHVEFGDTLETTIYKEMNEELGLERGDITDISFIKYFENSYGEGDKKSCEINFVFEARIKDDKEVVSQEDHIEFEWITMSELSNINFLPKGII